MNLLLKWNIFMYRGFTLQYYLKREEKSQINKLKTQATRESRASKIQI